MVPFWLVCVLETRHQNYCFFEFWHECYWYTDESHKSSTGSCWKVAHELFVQKWSFIGRRTDDASGPQRCLSVRRSLRTSSVRFTRIQHMNSWLFIFKKFRKIFVKFLQEGLEIKTVDYILALICDSLMGKKLKQYVLQPLVSGFTRCCACSVLGCAKR